MALAATGSEVASAAFASPPVMEPAPVSSGHYRVEAMLVSIPATAAKGIANTSLNGFYANDVVAHLVSNQRASVLSLPSVESAARSSSKIDITQAVPLPNGASRETGIKLKVTPSQNAAHVYTYTVLIENVRFNGFEGRQAARPTFSTQRVVTTLVPFYKVPPGYNCVNLPALGKLPKTYDADGRVRASIADANERQLLFVKITRG
jgi:hypothetical protein